MQHSQQVKKLFGAALDVPESELQAFLSHTADGNTDLKNEVMELLRAHRAAGNFIGADLPEPLATGSFGDSSLFNIAELEQIRWLMLEEQPGQTIDRYKLLQILGEGGCGIVFRAEQQLPVRRVVALKLIKQGMESAAVLTRFEAERQTLALMDHPDIAKLFDAGTTPSGRPYFVMELVPGIPVTRFCDEHRMSIARRVELMIRICRAVQHAHQKGIVHRDLKPSNLLVVDSDGTASPKVIDFGISRLVSSISSGTDEQLLGTPRYMSPEHASSDAQIDTRSDVYSLGAVLYELLCGMPAMKTAEDRVQSVSQLAGVFQDQPFEPPTRRLTHLVNSHQGVTQLAKIAAARHTAPKILAKSLREDLDWILAKALQRDRSSRYDSVAALADDLQRYLHRRPVLSAPPSRWYQFRRYCGRNKALVGLTAAVAAALIWSLIAVLILLVRARQTRDLAIAMEQDTSAAKADALSELRESYLQRAIAGQRSRSPGQRLESLEALGRAAILSPSIELRNQAIACMTLPDIRLLQSWKLKSDEIGPIFSRDMGRYALPNPDGGIDIFRTENRQLVEHVPGTGFPTDGEMYFSPDGQYLVTYCRVGPFATHVWNLATGKPIYADHRRNPVSFSSDSARIAIDVGNGDLQILSLPTANVLKTIKLRQVAKWLFFSPDNSKIAIVGQNEDLRILNLHDESITLVPNEGNYSVIYMAWHPDGKRLAFSGDDRMSRIQFFNIDSEELDEVMKGHMSTPVDLQFTHDGRYLISGAWDNRIKIWDVATGAELLSNDGFTKCLRISGDDARIAISTATDHRLYQLIPSQECRTLPLPASDRCAWSADFSPDGRLLAATTTLGISVWNSSTGIQVAGISCPGPRSVLFSNDGTELFASTVEGVQTWKTSEIIGRFDISQPRVSEASTAALAVSGDQSRIVFGHADGTLWLADPHSLEAAVMIGRHSTPPRFVQVSPDGAWAASSVRHFDANNTFKVWNLNKHKLEIELPASADIAELGEIAFSADSKTLVTADHRAFRWYSVGDWKLIRQIDRDMQGPALGVTFSPDGKLAALSGTGYAIILLDARTGSEVATLDTPIPHMSASLRFSRDSTQLAVCGAPLMVWNIPLLRRELALRHLDWHW